MLTRRALLAVPGLLAVPALAQPAALSPAVKLTVGQVKVPHVVPIHFPPAECAKLGVELEMVNFVRYADVRTALASGSIEVGAIGPADVPIAVSQGLRTIVGLFGVGTSAKHSIVRNSVGVEKWEDQIGFAIHPQCWALGRCFACPSRNRRLARDFEPTIASATTFL